MNVQIIKNAGIDYDEGLNRFSNKPALYEKHLKKFSTDLSFVELKSAMENDDMEAAFRAAHTLRGTTGNLSIAVLYNKFGPFVEMLRGRSNISAAKKEFPIIEELYCHVAEAIINASK